MDAAREGRVAAVVDEVQRRARWQLRAQQKARPAVEQPPASGKQRHDRQRPCLPDVRERRARAPAFDRAAASGVLAHHDRRPIHADRRPARGYHLERQPIVLQIGPGRPSATIEHDDALVGRWDLAVNRAQRIRQPAKIGLVTDDDDTEIAGHALGDQCRAAHQCNLAGPRSRCQLSRWGGRWACAADHPADAPICWMPKSASCRRPPVARRCHTCPSAGSTNARKPPLASCRGPVIDPAWVHASPPPAAAW